MISQERLKELVHYDPQTGIFTARGKRKGVQMKDGRLGSLNKAGYLVTRVEGKKPFLSRLAWLYMTGAWPPHFIDHKNGEPTDNRWENLRIASSAENNRNAKKSKTNTVGVKGVSWRKDQKKFIARISVNDKSMFLGYFTCPAAAHFAYQVAADKHFGEFARFA